MSAAEGSINMIAELQSIALSCARGQIGVQDSGLNDGPEIRGYNAAVSALAVRIPWGACFVAWCYAEAAKVTGVPNPHPPSSYRREAWLDARRRMRHTVILADEVLHGGQEPSPGSLIVWESSSYLGEEHVGLLDELTRDSLGPVGMMTIEGNVTADGVPNKFAAVCGVHRLRRSLFGNPGLTLLGFIDYSRAK